MDFAKKILGKYGWKEGDGLGKNNNGIAAPLKASLKFDNAGLGVDRATEFNDHWWERCFNEAASNVTVKVEQNGEVSTSRKAGEDAVEISTKGYSARKLKKAKDQQREAEGGAIYEHFLKSALLTQSGGEVTDSERIKPEDIAVSQVHVMTDDELFKACGGRTAHKGARHGLKLSGKLARLEQQEREMLAKLQAKQNEPQEVEPTKTKKKKRKKDKIEPTELEQEEVAEKDTDETESTKSVKNKKRNIVETVNDETTEPVKSKKKKKKHKETE
ncbi:G patch domain-containing protein 4 [Drosophila innubila]|uniref:G patch domain-containing protein 4 n=1 Tax=Drosophila innubila TaxID=198719 RepID=UPI00148BCD57|nr:G patch domain-containing protein 4 [Drosophila innubila]